MRLVIFLLLLFMVGCSTAPIADSLDYCFPAKTLPPNGRYYGGVVPTNVTAPPVIEAPVAPPIGDPFLSESP